MIDDTIKKVDEKPVANVQDVVDVDLGFVERKKFRIAGDYNRMLELNVSDLNITQRLTVGYPKLKTLCTEAQDKILSIPDTDDKFEGLEELAKCLTEIDKEMRKCIDEIFDANVSETCAPSGNMYDPVNGQYRFERIIDVVTTLYTNGLNAEFEKLKNRVESKTSKYTKAKKNK